MALSPNGRYRVNVTGARGKSFADVARTSGAFGVAPGDTDAQALDKFADYAITKNPGFKGGQGDPGLAANTFSSVSALKAADVNLYKTAHLTAQAGAAKGVFFWTLGNYTGQADDISIIKADSTALGDGAWVRQGADGISVLGSSAAIGGRTVQQFRENFIDPEFFGARAKDAAPTFDSAPAFEDMMQAVAFETQAPDPYNVNDLTAARIARRVKLQGKVYRLAQPVVVPNRKVDRTNSYLRMCDGTIELDGNFVAMQPSVTSETNPVAEFMAFDRIVFRHANPANTASLFSENWLRMQFTECEWWQLRCLNSTVYAQEWLFQNCLIRNTPAGQTWFKAAGGYAIRSENSKYQFNGGALFEMNSPDAGVVGCSWTGDTVESNTGTFLRLGQCNNVFIGKGMYAEKNTAPLIDLTTLPGGVNRGVVVCGALFDTASENKTNTNFYDVIVGNGGLTSLGNVSLGTNIYDNTLSTFGELITFNDQIQGAGKLMKRDEQAQIGIVPNTTDYTNKIVANRVTVTPSNGVEALTVALPPARKGGQEILVVNTLSGPTTTFTVLPSYSADGGRFLGGSPDVGVAHPTGASRFYIPIDNGVWTFR